jgi:hypothetical protein
VGVHVNTPVVGLMVAFVGAPKSRLNVSTSPFGSVAVLVKAMATFSKFVLFTMALRIGGVFVTPASKQHMLLKVVILIRQP